MTRRDIVDVIEGNGEVIVDPSCWNNDTADNVHMYSQEEITKAIIENSTTCIKHEGEGLLIIKAPQDLVTEIQSYYIRTELI